MVRRNRKKRVRRCSSSGLSCSLFVSEELPVFENPTPEGLVMSPHRSRRDGWRDAFAGESQPEGGLLLEQVPPNAFEREEWKW